MPRRVVNVEPTDLFPFKKENTGFCVKGNKSDKSVGSKYVVFLCKNSILAHCYSDLLLGAFHLAG